MSTTSYILQKWSETFKDRYPIIYPWVTIEDIKEEQLETIREAFVSEIKILSVEIYALYDLLNSAKYFDELTRNDDFDFQRDVKLLKKVAILVGIDLKELFKGDIR